MSINVLWRRRLRWSRSMWARPRRRCRSPMPAGIGCSVRSSFAMTAPGRGRGGQRGRGRCCRRVLVKVGVEAAGHYHRPLLSPVGVAGLGGAGAEPGACHRAAAGAWAGGGSRPTRSIWRRSPSWCWPAAASRSRRRDAVIGELAAWAAHRHRRVATRTATKNQLLGQLDRCLPGSDAGAAGCAGHQGRSAGRGRVRRPAPARRAGRGPVHPVRRRPRPAGPPAGRRPAGRGGPGRAAHPGRCGRPAGAGRRPGAAGRPGRADRPPPRPSWPGCCRRARSRR